MNELEKSSIFSILFSFLINLVFKNKNTTNSHNPKHEVNDYKRNNYLLHLKEKNYLLHNEHNLHHMVMILFLVLNRLPFVEFDGYYDGLLERMWNYAKMSGIKENIKF